MRPPRTSRCSTSLIAGRLRHQRLVECARRRRPPRTPGGPAPGWPRRWPRDDSTGPRSVPSPRRGCCRVPGRDLAARSWCGRGRGVERAPRCAGRPPRRSRSAAWSNAGARRPAPRPARMMWSAGRAARATAARAASPAPRARMRVEASPRAPSARRWPRRSRGRRPRAATSTRARRRRVVGRGRIRGARAGWAGRGGARWGPARVESAANGRGCEAAGMLRRCPTASPSPSTTASPTSD